MLSSASRPGARPQPTPGGRASGVGPDAVALMMAQYPVDLDDALRSPCTNALAANVK